MSKVVETKVLIPEQLEEFYRSANPGVVKYPDPVLRRVAVPVQRISPGVKALIKRMLALVKEANGLGLAAPQVGVSERVIVIAPVDESPTVLVNPEVVSARGSQLGLEGCLSLPGLYGDVERADEVEVRFLDVRGKQSRMRVSGIKARIVLHEIDHLDGVLFIDRAVPSSLHWHLPTSEDESQPEI